MSDTRKQTPGQVEQVAIVAGVVVRNGQLEIVASLGSTSAPGRQVLMNLAALMEQIRLKVLKDELAAPPEMPRVQVVPAGALPSNGGV